MKKIYLEIYRLENPIRLHCSTVGTFPGCVRLDYSCLYHPLINNQIRFEFCRLHCISRKRWNFRKNLKSKKAPEKHDTFHYFFIFENEKYFAPRNTEFLPVDLLQFIPME